MLFGAKQAAAGGTVAPAVFVVAGLSVAFLRPRAANLAVGGVSGDEDDSEDSDSDAGAATEEEIVCWAENNECKYH